MNAAVQQNALVGSIKEGLTAERQRALSGLVTLRETNERCILRPKEPT